MTATFIPALALCLEEQSNTIPGGTAAGQSKQSAVGLDTETSISEAPGPQTFRGDGCEACGQKTVTRVRALPLSTGETTNCGGVADRFGGCTGCSRFCLPDGGIVLAVTADSAEASERACSQRDRSVAGGAFRIGAQNDTHTAYIRDHRRKAHNAGLRTRRRKP